MLRLKKVLAATVILLNFVQLLRMLILATDTSTPSIELPGLFLNTSLACLSLNSDKWLKARRHGNMNSRAEIFRIQRMMMTNSFVKNNLKSVLQETLAHDQSQILNLTDQSTNSESRRRWAVRLIYLVIYRHQYQPAFAEFATRSVKCQEKLEAHDIGPLDFECPQAKFLAVSAWHNGIGANLNHIIIPALMAGLATNRTVLIVNNLKGKRAVMKVPWLLASCRRHDFQCFFAPPTPCVPTIEELTNARALNKTEKGTLFRDGTLPTAHENDRLIYIYGLQKTSSFDFGGKLVNNIYTKAISLITESSLSENEKEYVKKSARLIRDEDKSSQGFDFIHRHSKIHHALLLFATRPNLDSQAKIKDSLRRIIPLNHFDFERFVGLPIRASDKCKRETECISFQRHLEAASKVWWRHKQRTLTEKKPAIVFTTESKDVAQEQREFDPISSIDFVTNQFDVLPDAGRILKRSNFTADEAMLSTIVSLKLQLMARVTVGNCCSNFHMLIHHFLREGCGAAPVNSFSCLQEDNDPLYRPCCWNGGKCTEARKREIAMRGNLSTADIRWLS